MTEPTTETARALLDRHGLPEDVIDGVLCLHAQELAARIRITDLPDWFTSLDSFDNGVSWAAGLIDPTVPDGLAGTANAAPPASSPLPDQTAKPVCKFDEGCHRVVPCEPGCGTPLPDQTLRDRIASALWKSAEDNIIAEWICCDPIDPKHHLCVQADAALKMARALIVDDPEAYKPAPLPDAVLAVLPPVDRAAVLLWAADELERDLQAGSAVYRAERELIGKLRRLAAEAQQDTHVYLSTGCLHGEHTYCSNVDGIAGLKKPAQCKFCTAPCTCPCHSGEEPRP